MGSYTTAKITRRAAQSALIHRITFCDDETLEKLVDELIFDARLRRAEIVWDEDENDNYLLE